MNRCPFAKANAGTIVSSECDRANCEWWQRIYMGTAENGTARWEHGCAVRVIAESLASIDWTIEKMREKS